MMAMYNGFAKNQHSTGARTKNDEAIGKSRGGNSTKIHLAVDSDGIPVRFELSGGQVHDIIYAEKRVNKSPNNYLNLAKIDIEGLNDGYLYTCDISKDGKWVVVGCEYSTENSILRIVITPDGNYFVATETHYGMVSLFKNEISEEKVKNYGRIHLPTLLIFFTH